MAKFFPLHLALFVFRWQICNLKICHYIRIKSAQHYLVHVNCFSNEESSFPLFWKASYELTYFVVLGNFCVFGFRDFTQRVYDLFQFSCLIMQETVLCLQEARASFYMAPITPFVYWRPKSGRLTQIFADVSNSSTAAAITKVSRSHLVM